MDGKKQTDDSLYYVCKYTPVELFAGFGEKCCVLEDPADDFELSDSRAHANLCGFGKSVIQAVLEGRVNKLVLVNCCDAMRRAYDVIRASGKCGWLYMLDLPHEDSVCEKERFAKSIAHMKESYARFSGKSFDGAAYRESFQKAQQEGEPYIGILGARVNPELKELIQGSFSLPVKNLTCVSGRDLGDAGTILPDPAEKEPAQAEETARETDRAAAFLQYSDLLLSQMPCFRMNNTMQRHRLSVDPYLRGLIYHTIKFCDYYAFEYACIKRDIPLPLLKIETDFTRQSAGQLKTRIDAFAETIGAVAARTQQPEAARNAAAAGDCKRNAAMGETEKEFQKKGSWYAAGIDSGSTSTDVVILNPDGEMVSSIIIPTGGGANVSARKCLSMAVEQAGIRQEEIFKIVTTGYGREYLENGDASVTEITCHAKGAHYLNPAVRTILDIGGQDIKAIRVDENGKVKNFLMNDKCAAGTGRFLELMARTLGLTLEEMSVAGLEWKENVPISSMCTVFAESEVVSLVAQNREKADIVHGLNVSVAAKVGALAARLGDEPDYMLTGGVANNPGVVKELENRLKKPVYICKEAQICGALGAALTALEQC